MKKRFEDDLATWLDAERSGDEEAAERALSRAVRHLDRRGPSAGFADAVLYRAGIGARAPQAWEWRWVGAAAAAGLLVAGVLALSLASLVLALGPANRVLAWVVPVALHWTGRWMSFAYDSWAVLAEFTVVLRAALATRGIQTVLLINAVVGTASLLGLKRLLRAPEELTQW